MPDPLADIFRAHYRPLEPIATGETAVLSRVDGIRAVLFDLYGTLFISASGEVGTARQRDAGLACSPQRALVEALRAMGVPATADAAVGAEHLFRAIEASHARSRQAGIEYPEVDIVELWREVLAMLAEQGLIDEAAGRTTDLRWLAVEYEARANPCWPMPHLQKCLSALQRSDRLLGIISNAQFFTPKLFTALLGSPAGQWGFDPQLQYYSYQHGRAKPGLALHRMAAEALSDRQIACHQVLYVGNDMLNDVLPACKLGFRTALFAGDARSLRRRPGEQQLEGILPDLVLTDLIQLAECIIDV